MSIFALQRRDIITFHTIHSLPLQKVFTGAGIEEKVKNLFKPKKGNESVFYYAKDNEKYEKPLAKIKILRVNVKRHWREWFRKVLQIECDIEPLYQYDHEKWKQNEELLKILNAPVMHVTGNLNAELKTFLYYYRPVVGVLKPTPNETACMYIDERTNRFIPSAKLSDATIDSIIN